MKLNLNVILEKGAKKGLVNIVVCEGWDERCLKSTADILSRKLANITLLGDPKTIRKEAQKFDVDISSAVIVDPHHSDLKEELMEKLVESRKHKGMTKEKAAELLPDVNYFGCLYVLAGYADAVAGSAICPTADLMRPALQILRKPDCTVSEVGIMYHPKQQKHFLMTDMSLNISPTSEQLSQMALNAIKTAETLQLTPKVAFLSYSTKGSGGDGEDLQLIRQAVEAAQKERPDLLIDGEMQFDAAINPSAAKRKCPDSPLKGDANIIVFPNLMTSNVFCHGILQFSDMDFEFTILEGMQKPVAILGRSTSQALVKNMILSCAMQVNADRGYG